MQPLTDIWLGIGSAFWVQIRWRLQLLDILELTKGGFLLTQTIKQDKDKEMDKSPLMYLHVDKTEKPDRQTAPIHWRMYSCQLIYISKSKTACMQSVNRTLHDLVPVTGLSRYGSRAKGRPRCTPIWQLAVLYAIPTPEIYPTG